MITIKISRPEEYDDQANEFIYHKPVIVDFEYSLRAISEWESKWKKPFLNTELSQEEAVDFYRLMAIEDIKEELITAEVTNRLAEYIRDPRTATTFSNDPNGGSNNGGRGKILTSEEIYASMFSAGLPLEFENRNLNTLLTILKVISVANKPPKKMSNQDILRQNSSLNAQRKAQLNTKG